MYIKLHHLVGSPAAGIGHGKAGYNFISLFFQRQLPIGKGGVRKSVSKGIQYLPVKILIGSLSFNYVIIIHIRQIVI